MEGVPWWPSGQDPGLSLLWPGFIPGRGTEIPQAMWCSSPTPPNFFIWKGKGPRVVKMIFIKNKLFKRINQCKGLLYSDSNQASMVVVEGRHTDKWNRIENPEINSHKFVQLIFDKGVKAVQWRKGSLFNRQCRSN